MPSKAFNCAKYGFSQKIPWNFPGIPEKFPGKKLKANFFSREFPGKFPGKKNWEKKLKKRKNRSNSTKLRENGQKNWNICTLRDFPGIPGIRNWEFLGKSREIPGKFPGIH